MIPRLLEFFRTGPDAPATLSGFDEIRRVYERRRWSVFLSVTLGYGLFYLCRVNFSVVKKPMLDAGLLDARQMGLIGSALLLAYAIGKFGNGFLTDRTNIARFMPAALLGSALVNLLMGSSTLFAVFVVLWAINGFFQSAGSAPSVVAISHWFSARERGTRYGIWSVSHSLGEGLTFAGTAFLVSIAGWRFGFWAPGLLCVLGALVLSRTLSDRPGTLGLPPVEVYKGDAVAAARSDATVGRMQIEVLKMPAVWILGLSSAMMYVARYGINNWGILFLQEGKGFSLEVAGSVLGSYPVAGFIGSVASGWVSDRFFGARRALPAFFCGLGLSAGLIGLWYAPASAPLLVTAAVALVGLAIGGLMVYLGGLMAVDIAPPRAVGAALGIVGMFSYIGAATQDAVSGVLIEKGRELLADGTSVYHFGAVFAFWIGASVLSTLLAACLGWARRARR